MAVGPFVKRYRQLASKERSAEKPDQAKPSSARVRSAGSSLGAARPKHRDYADPPLLHDDAPTRRHGRLLAWFLGIILVSCALVYLYVLFRF